MSADAAHLDNPAAAAREPKVSAALLKVQQLDGALVAVDQRAAAAAEAARRAEERGRLAQDSTESLNLSSCKAQGENAACEAGGLQGAMARQRHRLQCAEQLQRALQGTSAPEAPTDVGAGDSRQAGLTWKQEAMLEALLAQPEEPTGPAINPYAAGLAELETVEARLAALHAASGCGSGASPVVAETVGDAQRGLEHEDDAADPDVEGAREGYHRWHVGGAGAPAQGRCTGAQGVALCWNDYTAPERPCFALLDLAGRSSRHAQLHISCTALKWP